ncbi:MAG: hypothetical protein IH830_00120 [Planctomycetes bacterium]|nr:hypothetical protein [Planctomycetota bacterium]
MSRENTIWLIVFLIGAVMLFGRAMFTEHGMAKMYVEESPREFVDLGDEENPDWVSIEEAPEYVDVSAIPADHRVSWKKQRTSNYGEFVQQPAGGNIQFSLARSIGVWLAALLTLFVLSFLIKDNPFYKIAESLFVGISAAYWMVVAFWDQIVPNLIGKLSPTFVRNWAMPGLGEDARQELLYLIPLILGLMLLWRLSPKGGWISRWPMAFFIGTFCGLRLIRFLQADFLLQIRAGIDPLYVTEGGVFDVWASLANVILLIGVLSCLVYFFFSFEHKGIVGKTAKLGIWFLMITFGAGFAYTVMGRIALLAIRLEFLFDDWLWLIDPTDKRLGI